MKRFYFFALVFLCLFESRPFAQTFPCDNGARIYFFRDTTTNGTLSYITNYLTIPTITDMCPMPTNGHNGLGANPIDNYLYYLNGTMLERLDANCNATIVCTLTSSSLYGCFDPHGRYWTVQGTNLVAIDINSCSIVKGPYPITGTGMLDVVFNPFDCFIYVNDSRYDTTGVIDASYTGIQFVPPGGTYGGGAVGSDGNLYGIAGMKTGGNLSVINLTTNVSNNVFNFVPGPTYARSDAASFPCYSVKALFSAIYGGGCTTTVNFKDSSQGTVGAWHWDFGDTLSGTSDTTSLQNPIHLFSGAGSYTVTLIVSIGGNYCLSSLYQDSTKLTVTVGGGSISVNAGPDVTICANNSTQLNVAGAPSGSTVAWIPVTGLSCSNCINPLASPAATTTYIVSVSDSFGCSGSDTVVVNVLPALILNFPRNYYICAEGGTPVTLTASGGTTYLWSPSASLSDSTIADPVAYPLSTITYTVTVSDSTCSDTALVTVYVSPPITPPTITQNGDTLSVPAGYAGYDWYLNGSPIPGANNYYYIPTHSGYYSVYVTDSTGCNAITASVVIVITSAGNISGTDQSIYLSPNPTGSWFEIRGLKNNAEATVELFNVFGQLIFRSDLPRDYQKTIQRIDISDLAKGIYFVVIRTEKTQWVRKDCERVMLF